MAAPENGNTVSDDPPNLGGRPRTVINYEQLRTLCGMRCPGKECAAVLGTRYETLDKRIREDFAEGLEVFDQKGVPIELADGFREFFRIHSIAGKVALRRAIWEGAIKDRNPSLLRYLGDAILRLGNPEERPPPGGNEAPADDLRELSREELNSILVARGLPTHLLTDGR